MATNVFVVCHDNRLKNHKVRTSSSFLSYFKIYKHFEGTVICIVLNKLNLFLSFGAVYFAIQITLQRRKAASLSAISFSKMAKRAWIAFVSRVPLQMAIWSRLRE